MRSSDDYEFKVVILTFRGKYFLHFPITEIIPQLYTPLPDIPE
jgi:hypothetical protein